MADCLICGAGPGDPCDLVRHEKDRKDTAEILYSPMPNFLRDKSEGNPMTPEGKSPSLTAQQRAEKISEGICEDPNCLERGHHRGCALTDRIAAEIRQAEEEGFAKGREQGAFECRHAKYIGVKEAYEDAAKMCYAERNNWSGAAMSACEKLASIIRARAAEAK